ncbi:MAG: hypothetical protein JSU79_02805 [Dehalococcoidales bacterium]|nr:MAG: hypothetical protein JSU79_02805 [Dehalococcoidales bacterium]
MKKVLFILVTAMVISVVLVTSIGVTAFAAEGPYGYGYQKPAPNSGDGNPDGSGFDDVENGGEGPAPNSGDGIPDGSGF